MSTQEPTRSNVSEIRWDEPRSRMGSFFGVAAKPRTYINLLYTLVVAFALGLTWFVTLVVLIAVGGALAVTLVGIPILIFTLYAWGWMAELERLVANALLGTNIPSIRYNTPAGPGFTAHLKARLSSPATWRTFIFVLAVRFVQGTAVFTLAVTVVAIPFGFLTAPVFAEFPDGTDILFFHITEWYNGLWLTVIGIPLIFAALHANNGLAWLSARLTEAFLASPPYVAPAPAAPGPNTSSIPSAAAAPTRGTDAAPGPSPVPGHVSTSARTNEMVAQLKEATREIGDQARAAWTDFEHRTSAAVKAWNRPASVTESTEASPASAAPAETESATETSPHVAQTTSSAESSAPGPPAAADEPPAGTGEDDSAAEDRLPVVEVDVVSRIVRIDGKELEVTRREFDLLALFAANPGRAFSREELLDRIWKNEYDITDRTIDTHVQRLRKKLGAAAESIQTVWGVGYRFAPPSADD